MINNLNSFETLESNKNFSKSSKFIENTKKAVRDVLIKTWIVASTMTPMSTASSTTMPASMNAITQIAPSNNLTGSETYTTQWETTNTEWGNWNISETRADNQNNSIEYKSIEITNIRPANILPIVGQIEAWDKKAYEHIEHLRIAEATRIRDMMWKYGAGNHSTEEYQQLMNRLNTGMTMENPKWYNNYEIIWWNYIDEPSDHAHDERDILNTLIDHANFKVVSTEGSRINNMKQIVDWNPNNIYIFWNSSSAEVDKSTYLSWENDNLKDLCKSKNFLIFAAGWNINKKNWILRNKIYHEDVDGDEHWLYSLPSSANWKNDNNPDIHLIVSIWTDSEWDINQTNETYSSSKFPVGFHNNVLFAWREFPTKSLDWTVEATSWKYPTSYVNYTNVAIADLCFQMFAEVKDVDELLEMIRNSTDLRDYIRFDLNGDGDTDDIHNDQPETQPLILMNPAWFFQKYLMPAALPTNLNIDETIDLDKGYYHGVIYQIPGAEVNINGQWIAFTDDNKDIILAQNPMTLKWRLNGKLLNKYNYKPGDTINGKILVVDDKRNGLNITKDFSVNLEWEMPDNINSTKISTPNASDTRYTIDGHHLETKPTKPGIYIKNRQKVIIK